MKSVFSVGGVKNSVVLVYCLLFIVLSVNVMLADYMLVNSVGFISLEVFSCHSGEFVGDNSLLISSYILLCLVLLLIVVFILVSLRLISQNKRSVKRSERSASRESERSERYVYAAKKERTK